MSLAIENRNVDDANRWPGVNAAYDFVLPSYQMLVGRFEAADNRLTALLTFASGITLGFPVFARSVNPSASFSSPWFIAGMLLFLCAAAFGVWGRATGAVTIPNPAVLFNENLHKNDWAFKKDQLFRAGQHFGANVSAIERKGAFGMVVTVAVLLEIIMFVTWLAQ
jgi:hypothetical protein